MNPLSAGASPLAVSRLSVDSRSPSPPYSGERGCPDNLLEHQTGHDFLRHLARRAARRIHDKVRTGAVERFPGSQHLLDLAPSPYGKHGPPGRGGWVAL